MFQVPAEKGRLLVLIYFKVKNKNDINMNLLHLLAKELEVYYNPKVHTKEQLMAKVGDALFSKGIVKKNRWWNCDFSHKRWGDFKKSFT